MDTKKGRIILLAFVVIPFLSDWNIKGINLGDFLLFITTIILLTKYRNNMTSKSIKLVFFTTVFLVCHLIYHSLSTVGFNLLIGFYFSSKILVYLIFVIYFKQYLMDNKLNEVLLRYLAIGTSILILIGIFINILLVFNLTGVAETIWSFTRSDLASYTFRGSDIIRMKSLFSEPSYFGVFLNFTMATLYLSNSTFNDFKYMAIIIFGSLMTFSFSSIICTGLFVILIFIKNKKKISFSRTFKISAALLIIISVLVFKDQLYSTIILRFIEIVKGWDNSAIQRLFSSWSHLPKSSILLGNGVGMTPAIWNNLAYILSDFGVIIFALVCIYLGHNFKRNHLLTISFIIICFLKGGYLSSQHIIYISLLVCYSSKAIKLITPTHNDDIEVLISTMDLEGESLFKKMNVSEPFLCMNQITNKAEKNTVNIFNSRINNYQLEEKGVGLSRNTLLQRTGCMISVLADDDMIFDSNFREIIIKKFTDLPDAEMLIFNLKNSQGRFQTQSDFIVNYSNFMRFGAARLVFRTDSIRRNNINFSLLFGGGTPFSSGEDTLFIKQCIQSGLKIYAVSDSIASLSDDRESTWFNGFNEKYFKDKGALFYCLSPRFYILNIIQFALRKKHLFEGNIKYTSLVRIMISGAKNYQNYTSKKGTYQDEK